MLVLADNDAGRPQTQGELAKKICESIPQAQAIRIAAW